MGEKWESAEGRLEEEEEEDDYKGAPCHRHWNPRLDGIGPKWVIFIFHARDKHVHQSSG